MKTKIYSFCILFICFIISIKTNAQSANKVISNLTSPTATNKDLLPDKNNMHNLGSITQSWKNVYADSAYYLKGKKFISAPGTENVCLGSNAGNFFVSGSYNTAAGASAYTVNHQNANTAFGAEALHNDSSIDIFYPPGYYKGDSNTATGAYSLYKNIGGKSNVATGVKALYYNFIGNKNTANGFSSMSNYQYLS